MLAYADGFSSSLIPSWCLCKEVWQLKKPGVLDKKEKQYRIKK